jgi:hypothetical protein
MLKNNSVMQYNIGLLYDAYREAGMTDKEIELIVATIEPLIIENTLSDLLETTSKETEDKVMNLIEQDADIVEISQALGLSQQELKEKFLHKLEHYVYNVRQNLSTLKEKVAAIHQKS